MWLVLAFVLSVCCAADCAQLSTCRFINSDFIPPNVALRGLPVLVNFALVLTAGSSCSLSSLFSFSFLGPCPSYRPRPSPLSCPSSVAPWVNPSLDLELLRLPLHFVSSFKHFMSPALARDSLRSLRPCLSCRS